MEIAPLDWSTEARGWVNSTAGGAIATAIMSLDYDGWGDEGTGALTDYTGLYQCMVPSGSASTFTFAEGYEYATGELEIPPDQLYWLNETLSPVSTSARIIVRLTNIYTGAAIDRVGVSLGEQDLQWFDDAETDASGIFRVRVPPGFVRLSIDAWSNGFRRAGMERDPSRLQFFLKPGEVRWLNISLYPRERTARLYGWVNDTSNNPISGARVYAEHGDTIATTITNSSGYYEIALPDQCPIEGAVRAPNYAYMENYTWIGDDEAVLMNWVLENAGAWFEGAASDGVGDIDGDGFYDVLYVNLTANSTSGGRYRMEGEVRETRSGSFSWSLTWASREMQLSPGAQAVSLEFVGEQLNLSGKNGYFVAVSLKPMDGWNALDRIEYFTAPHTYLQFDEPNAVISTPIDQWLVDSDYDGLYNYLVLNVTLNARVSGNYTLMAVLRDIWGSEFDQVLESVSLGAESKEVQLSFRGTNIYRNGEDMGSCYLVLFDQMPETGSEYIHSLFLYTPYDYEIFQRYPITANVSGYVTDIADQPIANISVFLYNTTYRWLNQTMTNESGYYTLGGWGGDWLLVVNDDEDTNLYQGNLSEITLVDGTNLTWDVRNLSYTPMDIVEQTLAFSDWNNSQIDWLLTVIGDNEALRFEIDVLQFGDGDGFVSEEEVAMVSGFLEPLGMGLPQNSTFTVDSIWYDLVSETIDLGLGGPVTSKDPVYIHMTGNYSANTTIPAPSPHYLELDCTYDGAVPQGPTGNNASYIYYIAPPPGWNWTGNQTTVNVTISGTDYITADPGGDPNPGDGNLSERVNITISSGASPTTCAIKGNVTLQGSSEHSGVIVTAYDNATQQAVGSAPTDPSGYYAILGLAADTYDVVAHKAGYAENRSNNHAILAGDTEWIDFTLYSYPPVISHTPLPSAFMGTTIEIYADVTDDGAVGTVILYYQEVGWGAYNSTPMNRIGTTSTYFSTIPAQSQAGYLYYYIWANDTRGNNATHPVTGNHTMLIYELEPPEISAVSALPSPAEYPTPVNVSALVTDGYNVETVTLWVEMPDSSTSNTTMDYDPGTGRYYLNTTYPLLGTYNYTIWANDTFDNWNYSSGSFVVQDTLAPTSAVQPLTAYWYSSPSVSVNATASDTGIGVASVELWYRFSTNNSTWGPAWTLFGTDTASPWSWSFDFLMGDGYYQLHSEAVDSAGNPEVKNVAEAVCALDTTPPTSSVDAIPQYWYPAANLTINATASDTLIGISGVELWYRFSSDNSTWGAWELFGADTAQPWSWTFNFSDGDGYYEFYAIGMDGLGNTETKSAAEASCALDALPPTILNLSAVPDPCELGQTINVSAIVADVSGIEGAWVEIRQAGSIVGNYSMNRSGDNYWCRYTPGALGTVSIVLSAKDNNDQWNVSSIAILVQDTTGPTIGTPSITPSFPEVKGMVNITAQVTDAAGVAGCWLNLSDPAGEWVANLTMDEIDVGTFRASRQLDILGTYDFVIWAVDENSVSAFRAGEVTTRDTQPPVADAGPAQAVTMGAVVTFDASLSTDNYGIENCTWQFNDNGVKRLYGVVVNYTFTSPDNYTITLTVRDYGGNEDTALTWVNVSAPSGTGTVTGTVLDENSRPVEGATVYVEGYPSIETTTDHLGRFTLTWVPIGNQTLIIVKDGFQRRSVTVNVLQDQSTPVEDIILARAVSGKLPPWVIYAVVGAIIAVVVVIGALLAMRKMRKPGATTIDELFLMYSDGRLIKHFTRRLRPDMDEDILSSMLVAVQDFVKDSFGEEGGLDEMKFGRFQIVLGRGKYIILAATILGDEIDPFKPQVAKCVKDIEEKYGDALRDWDGEINKLKGTFKYVMDLIDGRYA
ncbi:MAG: carboxypeptidase regulatory-like domain-containing protein [Candidatus Thermoplasmatota archaeon]